MDAPLNETNLGKELTFKKNFTHKPDKRRYPYKPGVLNNNLNLSAISCSARSGITRMAMTRITVRTC